VRVTAALNRLLGFRGTVVEKVVFQPTQIIVNVRLRSRRLRCPCGRISTASYDRVPAVAAAPGFRPLQGDCVRGRAARELLRLRTPAHRAGPMGTPGSPPHARLRGHCSLVGPKNVQDCGRVAAAHIVGNRRQPAEVRDRITAISMEHDPDIPGGRPRPPAASGSASTRFT
jgi:hypothetical protein